MQNEKSYKLKWLMQVSNVKKILKLGAFKIRMAKKAPWLKPAHTESCMRKDEMSVFMVV